MLSDFINKTINNIFTMLTDQEELKTMIKCFRVHDLQTLLCYAGRSKVGKKQELQNRALSLLQLKSKFVGLKIIQLYESMQKGYKTGNPNIDASNTLTTNDRNDGRGFSEKGEDSISIVGENENQGKDSFIKDQSTSLGFKNFPQYPAQSESNIQLPVTSLYYPIHPDVKFKKLPFYKVLYELLRPSSLVPQSFHIQQKISFVFYLTPQQAAAICLSRDSRPGMQQDYSVQGQLRFCLLETTSQQEDSFPANLIVRVNNKYCMVQEPLLRKKKGIYVKDCSPPINITPLMKINPSESNKVEVHWNTEYGRSYAMGIYLVRKKSSEDLLNRLKTKSVQSADYTRGMIKDKLSEEADSEIVTTSLRVSLMCPLGKMKLKNPCRASTCDHLQCFDASLFLQMNEKKPTWLCPVCDNPTEYDKLIIDGYFQEILSSDKLLPEVNEVELHSDGSWSSLAVKPEENSNVPVKMEAVDVVELVEEDDDDDDDDEDDEDEDDDDDDEEEEEEKEKEKEKEKEEKEKEKKEEEKKDTDTDMNTNTKQTPAIVEEIPKGKTQKKSRARKEPNGIEKRKVDEIDLTISDSDDEPLIWYKRRESSKKRNCIIQSCSSSNRSSPSVINLDSDSSDSFPCLDFNPMSHFTPNSLMDF